MLTCTPYKCTTYRYIFTTLCAYSVCFLFLCSNVGLPVKVEVTEATLEEKGAPLSEWPRSAGNLHNGLSTFEINA